MVCELLAGLPLGTCAASAAALMQPLLLLVCWLLQLVLLLMLFLVLCVGSGTTRRLPCERSERTTVNARPCTGCRRAVRPHLPPQDCPRVFPLEGARDALGNPKGNECWFVVTGSGSTSRNPINRSPENWAPTSAMCFSDHGGELETLLKAHLLGVLESAFPVFVACKHKSWVTGCSSVPVGPQA